MANVTRGKTFNSGDTVYPDDLHQLVDNAKVTAIQTADISDSQITTAKLATVTAQALLPAGAVMPFAMNSAPSGWLAADGAAVSRSTYATLFAAIGTAHGSGNGSTTFNLPDLRGYFVRGVGTNADGIASGAFGAKQEGAFSSHTHTGTTASAGAHTHTYTFKTTTGGTLAGGDPNSVGNGTFNTGSAGAHTHTFTTAATGGTETRPANIALLYCIKF